MGTDVWCRPHLQPLEEGLGLWARLPLERPKSPYLGPRPIAPIKEGAELGGQECHEEEGDAHREGQVFPLGAGPADALLQLGHLGVLSLKVFCGEMERQTDKGWAARRGGGTRQRRQQQQEGSRGRDHPRW